MLNLAAEAFALLDPLRDDLDVVRNLRDQDDIGPAGDARVSAIQPAFRPMTSNTITR